MAEFFLRIGAATSTVLLLSPVVPVSANDEVVALLPPSVTEVVLLANDGTLPVVARDLAVITASVPTIGEPEADATLEAPPSLASLLGATSVIDLGPALPAGLQGAPVIPSEFIDEGFDTGYFATTDLTEPALLEVSQPSSVVRLPAGAAAARLTGPISIPVDGLYEFTLTTTGTARMLIDDTEVMNLEASGEGAETPTTTVSMELTAGTTLSVQLELVDEVSADPVLALGWRPPDGVTSAAVAQAVEAAAAADTVIIHVPSLPARTSTAAAPATVAGALPHGLAELIPLVAVSNPRIVVVTDAAAHDDLDDWTAPAILHVPTGTVDLTSIARIMLGEAQPGGTLQVDLPLPHGPPEAEADDVTGAAPPTPVYPAGHGLSYWRYQLLALTASPTNATIEISSTGTVKGETKLYVTASAAAAPEPHPAATGSVELAAGETTSVTIPLDLSSLDLDSPDTWPITLRVGTSPDDLTLTTELTASAPPRSAGEKARTQQKQGGIVRPAVSGLTLTTGAGIVALENAVDLGGRLRLTGTLPTVTVTDDRQGAAAGWTVSARASDLAGPGGPIPASNLGWVPTVLAGADGVTAGPPIAGTFAGGDGLAEPAVLGHAPRGGGTVQFGAEFVLETATTVPGSYSGTLTVTLFPAEGAQTNE